MFLQKFLSYLTFWKKQPTGAHNLNLKMMHGINRISIFMMLFAIIYYIIKHVF